MLLVCIETILFLYHVSFINVIYCYPCILIFFYIHIYICVYVYFRTKRIGSKSYSIRPSSLLLLPSSFSLLSHLSSQCFVIVITIIIVVVTTVIIIIVIIIIIIMNQFSISCHLESRILDMSCEKLYIMCMLNICVCILYVYFLHVYVFFST